MISIIRDLVTAVCLFMTIVCGSRYLMHKVFFEVKKAALIRVSRGPTPLSVVAEGLTGKKLQLSSQD